MSTLAIRRLRKEMKRMKKKGNDDINASPVQNVDGSLNLFIWNGKIRIHYGDFAGATLEVKIHFNSDFPANSCRVIITFPNLFHVNVYPSSGSTCLSLLNVEKDWRPSVSVFEILRGVQALISQPPNCDDPANGSAVKMYRENTVEYRRRAMEQVNKSVLRYGTFVQHPPTPKLEDSPTLNMQNIQSPLPQLDTVQNQSQRLVLPKPRRIAPPSMALDMDTALDRAIAVSCIDSRQRNTLAKEKINQKRYIVID
ncbi:hypothetical protein PCE1_004286 [Barthelona sp. PCE]